MQAFEQSILGLFKAIHPLDNVSRAGFVLRGVAAPESVAAHSHFISLMTLLYADAHPDLFDRGKAVSMALMHDLCEAQLMDIPMPSADAYLREAKDRAEQAITESLLAEFAPKYAEYHREFLDAATPEAMLVRGLDKAQMMIKILMYEREGRGRLREFWLNPKNFSDFGLEPVSALFDAICDEAGHPRPH